MHIQTSPSDREGGAAKADARCAPVRLRHTVERANRNVVRSVPTKCLNGRALNWSEVTRRAGAAQETSTAWQKAAAACGGQPVGTIRPFAKNPQTFRVERRRTLHSNGGIQSGFCLPAANGTFLATRL